MPIRTDRQNWTPGQTVKVGFLTLKVLQVIPTPGDYRPDVYILENANSQQYEFTPHHGIRKRPKEE